MNISIKCTDGSLMNFDNVINIQKIKDGNFVRFRTIDGNYFSYGYGSIERCQEIIDEIQAHIEFVEEAKTYNTSTAYKNDYEKTQYYKAVYIMPKE